MPYTHFADLKFTDEYLFSAFVEEPSNLPLVRHIVEMALERKVEDIRLIGAQVQTASRYRGKGYKA